MRFGDLCKNILWFEINVNIQYLLPEYRYTCSEKCESVKAAKFVSKSVIV